MFDIDQNNNIIIKKPIILQIKEFKKLWDRDTTKNKSKANKDFAYLYLKNDFKSPYRNAYTQEELPSILKKDLQLPASWKETTLLKEAEEKFIELQTTKSLKMLMAAEMAMEQITRYFEDFDITKISDEKQAEAITKLMGNIKNVDEVVGRLETAKEKVAKELQTKKLSGSKVLSSRELPKNKRR